MTRTKTLAIANNASLSFVRIALFILVALFLTAAQAHAIGMMIPKDKTLPALAIKSHRVEVAINEQGAETTVDQVFVNNTNRDLEAIYIFPMPEGAATTDFSLWINGKETKGEVLDAKSAKNIYREIVTRMKDPGLLEYMGGNLFRASVYPVPRKGEQRVKIKYAQVIPYDAGVCRYTYPLRTDRASAKTIEDFTVSVDIRSSVPIRSVYSPTHETSLTRDGDNHVRTGFEKKAALLDRDFDLYYTLSEKDVGISMIGHREKGDDGYFMLLVTPGADPSADQILAKDVIFILDTSGSMQGEKIVRAKEALSYCLNSLFAEDRFNIVRFSDGIEPMAKELLPASKENITKGLAFIKNMRAAGGTNINEAMLTALKNQSEKDRPGIVVFLTDGQPTVGITDMKRILENTKEANPSGLRIFSFGVGTDINTHLLDKLSGQNGGTTAYVRPDAEIEREVSSFFNKIEKPVLSDVTVDFGKANVYDVFPKKLPDLFAGNQLTLIGRYKNGANTAVMLEGHRASAKVGHANDVTYPKKEPGNNFIKQLWAQRKVGYLLDEIRLNGENKELVDEVTRLGKEYGIVTPYTSYLVTEPKTAVIPARDRRGGVDLDDFEDSTQFPPSAAPMDMLGAGGKSAGRSRNGLGSWGSTEVMKEESGASAVYTSKRISRMKDDQRVDDNSGLTRYAGGKSFVWQAGYYVDTKHKDENKLLKIKYGSDAYFRLLELFPKAKEIFILGEKIIVSLKPGTSIMICQDGKTSLPDSKITPYLP